MKHNKVDGLHVPNTCGTFDATPRVYLFAEVDYLYGMLHTQHVTEATPTPHWSVIQQFHVVHFTRLFRLQGKYLERQGAVI